MRYHTAPIIGFAAYLEKLRYESGENSPLFEGGRQFQCYVKDMRIIKTSKLEGKISYRKYSLYFTYGGYGGSRSYTFRLDPEHSFFNHVVEGMVQISGSSDYEVRRSSYYKESHVRYSQHFPRGDFSGSYYNWHSERGEFSGKVVGNIITLGVRGSHYRRDKSSPYYELSANERTTSWNFEIPLTQIKLPRLD